ncbi:MAG: MBL fold metallo-hydrolase [Candidatus Promineifilaceae bacterium]
MDILTQVAPDIVQLRLPLPFRLNHIYSYLIRDHDQWVIVDCGLNTSLARQVWQEAFKELNISPSQISRIIVTHAHPDHIGLAGWLQALSGASVLISADEQAQLIDVWRESDTMMVQMAAWYIANGLNPEWANQVVVETKQTGDRTHPLPIDEIVVPYETELAIGDRRFRTIRGPGHSNGQLMLHDVDDKLLLCGDHVLMKITPHIGYWPSMKVNPLRQFLNSLQALSTLDVRLALPGHRALITDWAGRSEELQQHHAERLDVTANCVPVDGANARQIAQAVFRLGDLNMHETRFAMAETLSHLELLVDQGLLSAEREAITYYYPA